MNRYYYYLVITFMLINTIVFVPSILINVRFHGAIMSMALAILFGSIFAILCTKAFERVPGQGFPDLLKSVLPGWIFAPLLAFFAIMWFIAGGIVLVAFAQIVKGYVNPDTNIWIILAALIFIAVWGATRSSATVLYITEIVLVLSVPFIIFVLLKATLNKFMDWDAIRAMGAYALERPSWKSLSAAMYVFTGYVNLAIFNRIFDSQYKAKYLWSIPLIGGMVLLTTFFIPIGLHGTEGVNHYVYIWFSTADSLRMEFGFTERVIFLFLLLYLNLSLIFGIIAWHVGTELVRSFLFNPRKQKLRSLIPWLICGLFGFFFLFGGFYINEKQLIHLAESWLIVRMPAEVLLVVLVVFLSRKVKSA